MTSRRTLELERGFYERHWNSAGEAIRARERDRIELTTSVVPPGVNRILDVGCGDGRLSEAIRQNRECFLVGFDLSVAALGKLSGLKVCGSAARMPFPDRSFELVVSTEMMEHLPEEIYGEVLKEICRVAKDFILITVPNEENLTENEAVCSSCGSRFHIWGHLRSYAPNTLDRLFRPFRLVQTFPFGEQVERYNPILLWVRQKLAGGFAWDEQTACYYCRATQQPTPKQPFLNRVCESLHTRLWAPFSKRPGWLLALYRRPA